jgi:hypothetical protein
MASPFLRSVAGRTRLVARADRLKSTETCGFEAERHMATVNSGTVPAERIVTVEDFVEQVISLLP